MVQIFRKRIMSSDVDSIFTVSKSLTMAYLQFLKGIEDKEQYELLNSNFEMCLGLFRHSLCVALDLQSTIEFKESSELVEPCIEFLKGVFNFDTCTFTKETLVQACSHCISRARNKAEEV